MSYPGFRQITPAQPEPEIVPEGTMIKSPKTIAELLILYKEHLDNNNNFRNTRTALIKYVVPGLGGQSSAKGRSSPEDINAALSFLNQIPIEQIENILNLHEKVCQSLKISDNTRYQSRSYLKKLLDWAVERGFVRPSERQIFYRFKEAKKSRNSISDIPLMKDGRPTWKDGKRLGIFDTDYVIVESKKDQHELHSSLSYRHKCFLSSQSPRLYLPLCWLHLLQFEPVLALGNEDLDSELIEFINFLQGRLQLSPATVESRLISLLMIFGWLHREKKIPLEELRLTTVVHFKQLNFKRSNFKNEAGEIDRDAWRIAKMIALEELEEETEEALVLINEFLDSTRAAAGAKIQYLKAVVSIAKFLYLGETKKFSVTRGYQDIPIIEAFRGRTAEFDQARSKNGPVIPREKRMIPWLQVLEVVEKLRIEADQTHRCHLRHSRRLKSGVIPIEKIKRTDWAIAGDVQQFLILAIMTANPPMRSRVYRELEIGRTLKKGTREQGVFIPEARMKNPLDAQWFIHLTPTDYKTGRSHGEWWGEINNTQFRDGKTLYEYIDEWLTKWRQVFRQPRHNYFFVKESGEKFDDSSFGERVKRMIFQFTEVPVNCHSLRSIYVTFLKESGASDALLESAATAQHHTREAQAKSYDMQALQSKLTPSFKFTQSTAEKFYKDFIVRPNS